MQKWIEFFKAHERLLLVAVVMGLGIYGFNHWVDKSAESAKIQAALSAQIAQVTKDQDAKNAAYVAQLQASFNQQQAMRDQEIANLVSAIAQRDKVTAGKVTEITKITDPLPALQALASAYGPELDFDGTPVTGPGMPPINATVPMLGFDVEHVKQFAVTKLSLDATTADLKDTETQVKNWQDSFAELNAINIGLTTRVDGLSTLIEKNDKACVAEKKALKDEARKSKWKMFWYGFAAGFGVRTAIKP
jgi:hypothetical protein